MTTDLLLSKAIEGFLIARRADGYSPGTLEQYHWALKMVQHYLALTHADSQSAHRKASPADRWC